MEAPTLSPEIATTQNEAQNRKGRYAVPTQNLGGTALAALAPAVTKLLTEQHIGAKEILTNIWDAARIVGEIHRSQTKAPPRAYRKIYGHLSRKGRTGRVSLREKRTGNHYGN